MGTREFETGHSDSRSGWLQVLWGKGLEGVQGVREGGEKAIQNSLKYLVKGRTTLSIAHRLSTLRDADRLIVIDNGRIVEEGTHDELDKIEDGIFHKLNELQNKSLSVSNF